MRTTDGQPALNTVQHMFLTFGTIVGVGFIFLPRGVVEKAREDAWITVLLAGGVSILSLWLITRVARSFPHETAFEYNRKLLGRMLGFLFNLLISVYFLFFVVTGIRTMVEVVRSEMLPFTPIEVTLLAMLLTVLYTSWHGLMPIVRLNESGLPISILLIFVFLLFAYLEADWYEMRAPFLEGINPILQPLPSTVYSYLGYEVLFLYYPFLVNQKKAFVSGAIGIGLAAVFYVFIVVGTIVTLGPEVTITQTYPVVTMAKVIELVRQFVERAELLLIILWLPLAYSTHVVTFFSAAFSFHRTFPAISLRWWMAILFPAVYFLAMVPENLMEMEEWSNRVGSVGLFLLIGYPLILLAARLVRRRRGTGRTQTAGDAG